jgi:chromosome segregation ATPase
LLTRLDETATQLAQLRASQPATDAVVGRIASSLHEQTEALAQVQAAHPQLAVRLDNLARDMAELTERQHALSQLSDRFDQLGADLVERLQTAQPELERQLERVQAELADLRARQTDPAAALAPIAERLERVADDVGRLQQPEPVLARLSEELAEFRAAHVDPSIAQNFLAERLDRVLAEIAALRNEQPGTAATDAAIQPLAQQVDQLRAGLSALREELQAAPVPVVDVAGALAPLGDRLGSLDERAAATGDRVGQLEGHLTRTSIQLDELTAVVTALRDTPVDAAGALAPIADRLAIVVDAVSSLHGDVAGLAEAMGSLRADRAGLAQLAGDTTARLDLVAASIAELHESRPDPAATNDQLQQLLRAVADIRESRPDLTSSFVVLTDLVESLQSGVSETRNRIDALHETLRVGDGSADLASVLEPVIDRLDTLGARAAVSEAQIGATLDDLADNVTRFDSEQAAAVHTHIDELRQAVHALGDRQANALMDVVQRFEQVSANASETQEAVRSIDAALAGMVAPRDDGGEQLGDLAQQVAALNADVRSSIRSVVGLSADLTALRSDVQTLTVAIPDASDNEAAVRGALAGIDESLADRDRRMRDFLQQLDASVGSRDADVRTALTALLDAIATTPEAGDVSAVAAQLESGLAELRRELQGVRQDASSELQSVTRTVDELRSEMRRSDEMGGGAGAALVASAATAMALLEARMDGEFDSIGQQMEALGTLLGQVIDSVHRVEAQVIGTHPMAERVRHSAASVLDALRTNVRQRQAHRQGGGPPPEIGSGRSY